MIGLYQKILERIISKSGKKPSQEDFRYYLEPLVKIFEKDYDGENKLKSLRLRCTSEGGKSELLEEITLKIKNLCGDSLFGGEIENPHSQEFRELEQKLKDLINKVLTKTFDENWIEKEDIVPRDIYQQCLSHLKKNNLEGKKKPYTQLMLVPCCFILKKN